MRDTVEQTLHQVRELRQLVGLDEEINPRDALLMLSGDFRTTLARCRDQRDRSAVQPGDSEQVVNSTVRLIRSFRFAICGVAVLLGSQPNARIHLGATIAVVGAGLWFGIPPRDWYGLVLALTVVWMAEALNTALEFLADVASPDYHPLVKRAKDVAAAAVLIAALGAVIIGLLVFAPHIGRAVTSE